MNDRMVSDWLCDAVADLGVECVFLLPSVSVDELNRAVARAPKLRGIVVGHELAAGYMADGYARVRRSPGVALVGGGPGAHYLLPAAVNARLERVSLLVLSGTPATDQADNPQFQDTGHFGSRDEEVYRVAMDQSSLCSDADDLPTKWSQATAALAAHRPAQLIIPIDVQTAPAPVSDTNWNPPADVLSTNEQAAITSLRKLWAEAEAPLLVLGPALSTLRDRTAVARLVATCGAPVTMTVGSLGLLASDEPANLGHFGHGACAAGHAAITDPSFDHVLFVGGGPGARDGIDWGQRKQKPGSILSRIDTTEQLSRGWFQPEIEVRVASLDAAVEALCSPDALQRPPYRPDEAVAPPEPVGIMAQYLRAAQEHLPETTTLFVDAGTHRPDAARNWRCHGNGDIQASSEQAPMGWAIAGAIGGSLARPAGPVVCLTGDGCMRMMGMELGTAARYNVPLILLVANNSGYASISERSENRRYVAQNAHLERVDWVAFSRLLGGDGMHVRNIDEIGAAIRAGLTHEGPFVIDIQLPPTVPPSEDASG